MDGASSRRSVARAHQLDPSVAGASLGGGVGFKWAIRPEAARGEPRGGDAMLGGETPGERSGASGGEIQIVADRSDAVGVALDRDRPIGVTLEEVRDRADPGLRCRVQDVTVELEVDPGHRHAALGGKAAFHRSASAASSSCAQPRPDAETRARAGCTHSCLTTGSPDRGTAARLQGSSAGSGTVQPAWLACRTRVLNSGYRAYSLGRSTISPHWGRVAGLHGASGLYTDPSTTSRHLAGTALQLEI